MIQTLYDFVTSALPGAGGVAGTGGAAHDRLAPLLITDGRRLAGDGMETPRQRALQLHGPVYLQLVSIIQSLALYWLLTAVVEVGGELVQQVPEWKATGLQILATFVVVVFIWHEYAVGLSYFPWVFGFLDSLIPFLFGVSEFGLAESIRRGHSDIWFWWMSGFTLVALAAYINQTIKGGRTRENDRDTLENWRRFYVVTIGYVSASWVIFASLAYLLLIDCLDRTAAWPSGLVVAVLILFCPIIYRRHRTLVRNGFAGPRVQTDAVAPSTVSRTMSSQPDNRDRDRIRRFWQTVEKGLLCYAEHSIARTFRCINREGVYLVVATLVLAAFSFLASRDWTYGVTWLRWTIGILAVAYIVDSLLVNTSITFVSRRPIHRLRSIQLSLLNVGNIALAFAVLYALAGKCFSRSLGFMDSVYLSFVTIATLGYGDIYPAGDCRRLGQITVIGELVTGFYFLAVVVTTVVSWGSSAVDD